MKKKVIFLLLLVMFFMQTNGQQKLNGKVFVDRNENGIWDENEKGLEGVLVSNGTTVVATDETGDWELNEADASAVFLIKPSGYAVPLDDHNLPQFAVVNNRMTATEDWNTAPINFPLSPSVEDKNFSVIFFGDTQARGLKEVNYIYHDVVEELIGTSAAFGISLGDNVADEPELMAEINQGIAHIGIPWYNTFGNHDGDRDAKNNVQRDDTFEKLFGPSTYAFEYGNVAFISLNNIYFNEKGRYRPHFTDNQLTFVASYLDHLPEDKLVVLYMHAPIVSCNNKDSMYKIIQDRKHCFSVSGHLHEQLHLFLDQKDGWKGSVPHHHLINATICGSWWCGAIDETGIPHATMNDGAPNGYSIIHFSDNQYAIQYKAARRPVNYQMNIYVADEMTLSELDTNRVVVNVFAGSERSKVAMQIDNSGEWVVLEKKNQKDPECWRMHLLGSSLDMEKDGQTLDDVFGYKMDEPSISYHMWETKLPVDLGIGTHHVRVRSTDMHNKIREAYRLFRIIK